MGEMRSNTIYLGEVTGRYEIWVTVIVNKQTWVFIKGGIAYDVWIIHGWSVGGRHLQGQATRWLSDVKGLI